MKWLLNLIGKIRAISQDKLIEPDENVGKGEKVIAEMTLELKQFYTLLERKRLEGEAILKEHAEDKEREGHLKRCKSYSERIEKLYEEIDLLTKMFWKTLLWELNIPEPENEGIGVRKGWKVVKFDNQEDVPEVKVIRIGGSRPFKELQG